MDEIGFSTLVERCYDAAFDSDEWPSLLHDVAVNFDGVGATLLSLSAGTPPLVSYSPALTEFVPAYNEFWWEHDLFLNYAKKHQFGPGLYVDSDYLPEELTSRHPFYQEFRRPQGVSSTVSFAAAPSAGGSIALSVLRRLDAQHVSFDERKLFSQFSRHLSKAVKLSARLIRAESLNQRLSDQLGAFDCAVAVVGSDARVLRTNSLFHTLEAEGLHVRKGRLTLEHPAWRSRLTAYIEELLAQRVADPPAAILAIPRSGGVLPLLVRGVPLLSEASDRRFGTPMRSVLLLILKPDLPSYPPLEPLLVSLGLTRGQARFALAVGSGRTLAEAADLFSVSPETARTTLKQVYAKLGINRQSQLARLIAKVSPLHR